ncbi:hypothetical protein AVEN_184391-1 [Araneus ventricosus]|uniref:Uncharacterized protein n=1 Tax=Araneus ventricosus TaxID=182803 RepID=A0A4Y2BGY1_ARAVE|nr:hypothetical protein AVEN_184391-1 [Araneus ventricosus]
MTRTTSGLAPPSPSFRATPWGGRLATKYDLACSGPHAWRIFSGIGFRVCHPTFSRSYHKATAASKHLKEHGGIDGRQQNLKIVVKLASFLEHY